MLRIGLVNWPQAQGLNKVHRRQKITKMKIIDMKQPIFKNHAERDGKMRLATRLVYFS